MLPLYSNHTRCRRGYRLLVDLDADLGEHRRPRELEPVGGEEGVALLGELAALDARRGLERASLARDRAAGTTGVSASTDWLRAPQRPASTAPSMVFDTRRRPRAGSRRLRRQLVGPGGAAPGEIPSHEGHRSGSSMEAEATGAIRPDGERARTAARSRPRRWGSGPRRYHSIPSTGPRWRTREDCRARSWSTKSTIDRRGPTARSGVGPHRPRCTATARRPARSQGGGEQRHGWAASSDPARWTSEYQAGDRRPAAAAAAPAVAAR